MTPASVIEPKETDTLLKVSHLRTSTIEEYGSIAVAVIQDDITHEPQVLHDLTGPVMLLESPELLERHDSMYSAISKSIRGGGELQPEQDTGGQASIASEVAIMAKNMIGCGSLSLSHGIALCANTTNAIWAGNFWILASVNVIVNFYNPS